MWPANFFSRFGPRTEKVVHNNFILKVKLNFRDWKIRGFEAFSLTDICQFFGINHLRDRSLDSHGRKNLSLQVTIGHLFQVRTNYLIHQQRNTLTE